MKMTFKYEQCTRRSIILIILIKQRVSRNPAQRAILILQRAFSQKP